MKKGLLALFTTLLLVCMLCGCDIGAVIPTLPVTTPSASAVTSVEVTPNHTQNATEVIPTPQPTAQATAGRLPFDGTQWEYLGSIPEFSGEPYYVINDNQPFFQEITSSSYEQYGELDALGRCTVTVACIGVELMPTEDRGEIGQVKPTGWHTVKYDCVNGKYLYNRCHLIGFQLTGENANVKNLITGTRYMNVDGMLPFENMVADYLKEETENHVMYRVTPIFIGQELVARGVLMEAYSVEDNGEGICFNVFCYNSQPRITIDYTTGESHLSSDTPSVTPAPSAVPTGEKYILNIGTKKFHLPSCSSASKISQDNRQEFVGSRDELIVMGYEGCGVCKP